MRLREIGPTVRQVELTLGLTSANVRAGLLSTAVSFVNIFWVGRSSLIVNCETNFQTAKHELPKGLRYVEEP